MKRGLTRKALDMITDEALIDVFSNTGKPSLLRIFFLVALVSLCAGSQTVSAVDETQPHWRRIRTNSVPYYPSGITVDVTGAVWVMAANGSEYDPGVWRLPDGETRFQYLTNSQANNWLSGTYSHTVEKPNLVADVNYAIQDKAGNVWYALTNRTVLCEKTNGAWLTFAMENTYNDVYDTDTTGVDSAHTIRLIDNPDGSQDVLLVANRSIKRVDSNFTVSATRTVTESYNNYLISNAMVDSHGRYWVANEYGIQFGPTIFNTTFPKYSQAYQDDPDIPPYEKPITGIMEDTLGNVWLVNGSYGATGIYCLTDPNGTNDWIKYDINDLTGASNQVSCLARGADGVMWFGAKNSGIIKYSPGVGWSRTPCADLGIPSEQVISMHEHDSTLWFVTDDNTTHAGVYALDLSDNSLSTWTYRENSTSLTSNRIKSIAGDRSGGVWFAAYDQPSVARLKADGTWVQYKEDTMDLTYERGSGSIPGIGVDSNNIVFMAPNRRAPIAYDINTEQWLSLPPGPPADTYFYGLYIDPKDGKWFCGADAVYHLNSENTAWTIYNTNDADKFHDYRIQDALMDAKGNMWFMSSFVSGEVTLMEKDPEGGEMTWYRFATGDTSNYKGESRVYLDQTGQVWNTAGQTFDFEARQWVDQDDDTLFKTRPMRFLNGDIPADMDLTGAPAPLTGTDQTLMTVDTLGNVYFAGGMVWLQSINMGIVVCSPIKGDVNRDNKIELNDVVFSLQILSGQNSGIQSIPVEVSGDGKVGAAESIYVLRKSAN